MVTPRVVTEANEAGAEGEVGPAFEVIRNFFGLGTHALGVEHLGRAVCAGIRETDAQFLVTICFTALRRFVRCG